MDAKVAEKVIFRYEDMGKGKLDARKATSLITTWLRAIGGVEDRFGNFLFQNGTRRWKFKEQVVRRESKTDSGWFATDSVSLIDTGNNILKNAAQALGREDLLERAEKMKASRAATRTKRADKAKADELAHKALVWAHKLVAQKHPDAYADAREGSGAKKEAAVKKISPELESVKQIALDKLSVGEKLDDGTIVSTTNPPIAAFFDEHLSFYWTETEGGVEYTIRFSPKKNGLVDVQIGRSSEMGLRMSASSMKIEATPAGLSDKGDGFISALIGRERGKMSAKVFMIISLQKRAGVGSRLLNMWCRMMDAYGINAWVAEAVGEEGQAAIEAWAKRGRLQILKQVGSNILVRCESKPKGEEWSLA